MTKQKKQSIYTAFTNNKIDYRITDKDDFINGFIKDNIVWKGFNTDEYKLMIGHKFDEIKKYIKKLCLALSILFIVITIASILFYKNISNKNGLFISIRYKLVFLFALAIYLPTLSLWLLSYTSVNDQRTAIVNDIKKKMQDILNKIDSDYKKNEETIFNRYKELDEYLKSFKGKKEPTEKHIWNKLQEIVGNNYDIDEQFNWLDIRRIDHSLIFSTYSQEQKDRLDKMSQLFSIICSEKHNQDRLNYAKIKPSQSDIFMASMLENPIVGFSAIFERPKELISLNYEGVSIYIWWNYFSDKDNPIAFYMGNTNNRSANTNF